MSSNLTWSFHIREVTRRVSSQTGIIYRSFYQHSSQEVLLRLYLAYVCPLLEYASQVWDPHQRVYIDSLERVQRFGLKMSCKQWDCAYEYLLSWADLPSLRSRRSILKLCYLNKSLHGTAHSTLRLDPREMDPRLRNYDASSLSQPFTRTDCYKFSF